MWLSSIQIVYTFNEPQRSPNIIYKVNDFLCKDKSNIQIGGLYYLEEDWNNDPKDIVDEMITLKEISNNHKGGFLHYNIHNCSCLVWFHTTNDFMVGWIYFDAFEQEYLSYEQELDTLFQGLYKTFSFKRMIKADTLFSWNMIEKEIESTQKGICIDYSKGSIIRDVRDDSLTL